LRVCQSVSYRRDKGGLLDKCRHNILILQLPRLIGRRYIASVFSIGDQHLSSPKWTALKSFQSLSMDCRSIPQRRRTAYLPISTSCSETSRDYSAPSMVSAADIGGHEIDQQRSKSSVTPVQITRPPRQSINWSYDLMQL